MTLKDFLIELSYNVFSPLAQNWWAGTIALIAVLVLLTYAVGIRTISWWRKRKRVDSGDNITN